MTFSQFYSTITLCPNLSDRFGSEYFSDANPAGYVLNNAYWLVQHSDGSIYAQVGNQEYTTRDLVDAAQWLWDNFANGDTNG